jgi:hypothetical protein
MENRLSPNRLDSQVHAHRSRYVRAIEQYMISFFLPFYFQGVKLVSPMLSGVYYLPFALAIIPFAGIAGWAL